MFAQGLGSLVSCVFVLAFSPLASAKEPPGAVPPPKKPSVLHVRVTGGEDAVVEFIPSGLQEPLGNIIRECAYHRARSPCSDVMPELSKHMAAFRANTTSLKTQNGEIDFERPPGALLKVWAHTNGLASKVVLSSSPDTLGDLELRPAPVRKGRAIGMNGMPVAGVRVVGVHPETGLTFETTTSAEGEFEFRAAPPGEFAAVLAIEDVLVGFTSFRTTHDVILDPFRSVQGKVVEEGGPVAGVDVRLISGDGVEVAKTTSDAKGAFAFSRVVPATLPYGVRAQKQKALSVEQVRVVPFEDPEPLILALKPGLQVSGKIVNEAGEPIRDALVTVKECHGGGGWTTKSSALGEFSVGPTISDCHAAMVNAVGHRFEQRDISASSEAQPVTIALVRQPPITGVVTDDSGRPLAGVGVWQGQGHVDFTPLLEGVRTDENGRFSFANSFAGPMRVVAKHAGFPDSTFHVQSLDEPVHLRMSKGAAVVVKVLNDSGQPVEGAVVSLQQKNDYFGRFGETDRQGLSRFDAVNAGTHTVFVYQPGSPGQVDRRNIYPWTTQSEIQVKAGEARTATVRVPDLIVDTIELVDSKGALIADAYLSNDGNRYGPDIVFENEKFKVRRTKKSRHFILAVSPTHEQERIDLEGKARRLKVTLVKAPMLRGRIIDGEGRPVTRFELNGSELIRAHGRFEFQHVRMRSLDSRFPDSFELCAGGFAPRRVAIPEEDGNDHDLPDIVMERGRTLSGRVVDMRTKELIHGAKLSLWIEGINSDSVECSPDEIGVRPDGTFALRHVPSDKVRLFSSAPGYEAAEVEVSAGADEEIVIELEPSF